MAGSTITVFFNGLEPSEGFRDGELAPQNSPAVTLPGALLIGQSGQRIEVGEVRPVPGFVFGLYFATVTAPAGDGDLTLTLGMAPVRVSVRSRPLQR